MLFLWPPMSSLWEKSSVTTFITQRARDVRLKIFFLARIASVAVSLELDRTYEHREHLVRESVRRDALRGSLKVLPKFRKLQLLVRTVLNVSRTVLNHVDRREQGVRGGPRPHPGADRYSRPLHGLLSRLHVRTL